MWPKAKFQLFFVTLYTRCHRYMPTKCCSTSLQVNIDWLGCMRSHLENSAFPRAKGIYLFALHVSAIIYALLLVLQSIAHYISSALNTELIQAEVGG